MSIKAVPFSYSLIVETTASAGGIAIFGEAVRKFSVQHISHGPRNSFPSQNEDDDDGVFTVVASTVSHQTQQLLCLAATTDHLTGNRSIL